MVIKLPFGLQNGQLVDVSSVESGLDCNCFCPSCGQTLVARKGNIKEHHFAHYNNKECEGSVETALHIYSKGILEKHKRLVLPPLYLKNSSILIFPSTEVIFDKVMLEKRINNIIPDVIGFINDKPLLIEIVVTNKIDRVKSIRISELGYSAIAIGVRSLFNRSYYRSFGIQDFERVLIEETISKVWINNLKECFILERIKQISVTKKVIYLDGFIEEYPIVNDCPINKRRYRSGYKKGKSYASARDDCWTCPFGQVKADKIYSYDGKKIFDGRINEVCCSGHRQQDIINIVQEFQKGKSH